VHHRFDVLEIPAMKLVTTSGLSIFSRTSIDGAAGSALHGCGIGRPPWPMRILVGARQRPRRAALVLALRQDGHRVLVAPDGVRLLDLLAGTLLEGRRAPVDLIIAEHRLPGVLGLSVLAGLREHDPLTPFVLIVSSRDGQIHGRARQLGAMVVREPFESQDLRWILQERAHVA
jgi:CheY-like chemotaxis protein